VRYTYLVFVFKEEVAVALFPIGALLQLYTSGWLVGSVTFCVRRFSIDLDLFTALLALIFRSVWELRMACSCWRVLRWAVLLAFAGAVYLSQHVPPSLNLKVSCNGSTCRGVE
jgi:hypothetical protein